MEKGIAIGNEIFAFCIMCAVTVTVLSYIGRSIYADIKKTLREERLKDAQAVHQDLLPKQSDEAV